MTTTETSPALVLSSTLVGSAYNLGDITWSRQGKQGYLMLHKGVRIANVLRGYRPGAGWTLMPEGFADAIEGMVSLRACAALMVSSVVVSPWFRDPTQASHLEWCADGSAWVAEAPGRVGPWPETAQYYRWVSIGMTHKVHRRQPGEN